MPSDGDAFALRVRASIDSRPHVPDFCHRGSTFRLFGISSESGFRTPSDGIAFLAALAFARDSANSHAHSSPAAQSSLTRDMNSGGPCWHVAMRSRKSKIRVRHIAMTNRFWRRDQQTKCYAITAKESTFHPAVTMARWRLAKNRRVASMLPERGQ